MWDLFCTWGTELLYTHSLWQVVDHSRSKMHETCLIIIHDPGLRPGLESNRGYVFEYFYFHRRTIFIGLRVVNNTGDFVWTDGSILTWAIWRQGQPNNIDNSQSYIGIYQTREYSDYSETHTTVGLCEKSSKLYLV